MIHEQVNTGAVIITATLQELTMCLVLFPSAFHIVTPSILAALEGIISISQMRKPKLEEVK